MPQFMIKKLRNAPHVRMIGTCFAVSMPKGKLSSFSPNLPPKSGQKWSVVLQFSQLPPSTSNCASDLKISICGILSYRHRSWIPAPQAKARSDEWTPENNSAPGRAEVFFTWPDVLTTVEWAGNWMGNLFHAWPLLNDSFSFPQNFKIQNCSKELGFLQMSTLWVMSWDISAQIIPNLDAGQGMMPLQREGETWCHLCPWVAVPGLHGITVFPVFGDLNIYWDGCHFDVFSYPPKLVQDGFLYLIICRILPGVVLIGPRVLGSDLWGLNYGCTIYKMHHHEFS